MPMEESLPSPNRFTGSKWNLGCQRWNTGRAQRCNVKVGNARPADDGIAMCVNPSHAIVLYTCRRSVKEPKARFCEARASPIHCLGAPLQCLLRLRRFKPTRAQQRAWRLCDDLSRRWWTKYTRESMRSHHNSGASRMLTMLHPLPHCCAVAPSLISKLNWSAARLTPPSFESNSTRRMLLGQSV